MNKLLLFIVVLTSAPFMTMASSSSGSGSGESGTSFISLQSTFDIHGNFSEVKASPFLSNCSKAHKEKAYWQGFKDSRNVGLSVVVNDALREQASPGGVRYFKEILDNEHGLYLSYTKIIEIVRVLFVREQLCDRSVSEEDIQAEENKLIDAVELAYAQKGLNADERAAGLDKVFEAIEKLRAKAKVINYESFIVEFVKEYKN